MAHCFCANTKFLYLCIYQLYDCHYNKHVTFKNVSPNLEDTMSYDGLLYQQMMLKIHFLTVLNYDIVKSSAKSCKVSFVSQRPIVKMSQTR